MQTQTQDKDLLFLELFSIDCYNAFSTLMETVDPALKNRLPKLLVPPSLLTNGQSHPFPWELLRLLSDSLPKVYSYFFDSPESMVSSINPDEWWYQPKRVFKNPATESELLRSKRNCQSDRQGEQIPQKSSRSCTKPKIGFLDGVENFGFSRPQIYSKDSSPVTSVRITRKFGFHSPVARKLFVRSIFVCNRKEFQTAERTSRLTPLQAQRHDKPTLRVFRDPD